MFAVPESVLLVSMAEEGTVGFVPLGEEGLPEVTVVARSSRPLALTYDPVEQVHFQHKIPTS